MTGRRTSSWSDGPASPRGASAEVHVWLAHLDRLPREGPALHAGLAPDEIERARASLPAGQRFARSRFVLRDLLSRYLSMPPAEIPLELGERGRPSLAAPVAGRLDFNLSHTGDLALFVFGWDRRVGVDVESVDRPVDWRALSTRSFSPAERRDLDALPEDERALAFLRGWSRKEAYAKARGEGFAYGFARFSVSLSPSPPGRGLVDDELDEDAVSRWWIRDVDLHLPFSAAVAGSAELPMLRTWLYSPGARRDR